MAARGAAEAGSAEAATRRPGSRRRGRLAPPSIPNEEGTTHVSEHLHRLLTRPDRLVLRPVRSATGHPRRQRRCRSSGRCSSRRGPASWCSWPPSACVFLVTVVSIQGRSAIGWLWASVCHLVAGLTRHRTVHRPRRPGPGRQPGRRRPARGAAGPADPRRTPGRAHPEPDRRSSRTTPPARGRSPPRSSTPASG